METIKTLDDIINHTDQYDIDNITYYTQTDDKTLIIPDTNLFQIYQRFIWPYVGVYKVSKAEQRYYRFKPYLLSLDVYNTPALAWMILMLNDRECASKFYLKNTVKLIPTNALQTVYNNVVTKSSDKLKANWNTYLRKVGNDAEDDT